MTARVSDSSTASPRDVSLAIVQRLRPKAEKNDLRMLTIGGPSGADTIQVLVGKLIPGCCAIAITGDAPSKIVTFVAGMSMTIIAAKAALRIIAAMAGNGRRSINRNSTPAAPATST